MAEAVGQIRVEASIGTAKYVAGAKQIKAETASLERDVKSRFAGIKGAVRGGIAGLVGALSVGAFVQIGRAALEYASKLGDVSKQLGVTTRDLQTFRYAAGQLGVSQGELEKGLENLTKTLGKVAVGAEKPAKALEAIGLNAQAVARMDTGDAFRAISDALAKVTDRAQRAAIETALFGEAGAKLDTMLAGGSAALNELAAAADELGIVLSDEQIQKADQTADKLEALQTVMQAKIAGVVSDNADAIIDFADALSTLVSVASQAIGWLGRLREALTSLPSLNLRDRFNDAVGYVNPTATRLNEVGRSVRLALPPANGRVNRSGDIGNFLARTPRAGGRRRVGRTPRDDSARDLFRFEQDEMRAQMDIIRAKQQLSSDYVERTSLGIQLLDLERQSYANELRFQVSQKDLTQAQADKLFLLYSQKDSLERQKVLQEEDEQRQRDVTELREVDFDLQREALAAQLDLAETIEERRDLELRMVELLYRQEKARLEAVIADEHSSELAKEEARRRLNTLNALQGAREQAARNRNRTPLQDFKAQWSDITEENEQAVVNALDSMADALSRVTDGWKEMKEAALDTLKSLFQQLLSNQIKQLFAMAIPAGGLGGIFGGGGIGGGTTAGVDMSGIYPDLGFASGGSFMLRGRGGVDKNIMSINGLPIARVSYGERVSIDPANDSGSSWRGDRGGVTMYVNTPDADSFRRSEGQITRQLRRKLA